ncbi:protein FANTASTIC FOUR 1-like [Cornus florida]|uniref:protein FANTASTIC FOUR 1-like n=1 Tax=Cornus florida TaxID=4283 RepID=UPI00289D20E9|nr:protein FANTASTIC FOUR 1-like [Cornus florida]
MSSSVVCQGLQSCLEPRLVEPLVLRHKLSPPKSNSSQSFSWPQMPSSMQLQPEPQETPNHENDDNKNKTNEIKNDQSKNCDNNSGCGDGDSKNSSNGDLGGWSFIQALTNTSPNCKEVTESEKVYVHPLVKRSSSMLSNKSLEMCTESLGSETGSDISESSDEFTSFSSESQKFRAIQRLKSRQFAKKLNRRGSFPPPLSSISGSDSVQVRPHREGGRLVIKAVAVSSCSSYFQAERVDGRLRISLLKECCVDSEEEEEEEEVGSDEVVVVEEHDRVHEDEAEAEADGEEEYFDGDDDGDDDDDDDDDDGHDDDEDGGDGDYWSEGIGGKSGSENEVGELPRPSRCKESGSGSKGMPSWGPLWVAIS